MPRYFLIKSNFGAIVSAHQLFNATKLDVENIIAKNRFVATNRMTASIVFVNSYLVIATKTSESTKARHCFLLDEIAEQFQKNFINLTGYKALSCYRLAKFYEFI